MSQRRDLHVRRTEVISPLRHAMCLIHSYQADATSMLKFGTKQFGCGSFGRDIQKLVVAQDAIVEHTQLVVVHHARMDSCSLDASHPQLRHLILHQSHKRSDHDTQSVHSQSRHLETYRLAATRRHQSESVAPCGYAFYYFLLHSAETVVAPILLQYGNEIRDKAPASLSPHYHLRTSLALMSSMSS